MTQTEPQPIDPKDIKIGDTIRWQEKRAENLCLTIEGDVYKTTPSGRITVRNWGYVDPRRDALVGEILLIHRPLDPAKIDQWYFWFGAQKTDTSTSLLRDVATLLVREGYEPPTELVGLPEPEPGKVPF